MDNPRVGDWMPPPSDHGKTHYVGDECPGGHWDEPSSAAQLVQLRAAIRAKAAWWDANRPDAPAFEVADDFRRLLGDEHE